MEQAINNDDGFDWPLLMYTATVLLRRTEAEFWKMTPRKLRALAAVHYELNSTKETGNKTGFIDQVI